MHRFAAALLCCCLWIAAPAHASAPKVKEAEASTTYVKLTFDQPMLTWSGESDLATIQTEPTIECRWYWEDDTTLSCGHEYGDTRMILLRDTTYRLTIGPGLLSQTGVGVPPQQLTVESSRPEVGARIEKWAAGVPQIWISADKGTSAQALAKVLSVELDHQSLRFDLVAHDATPGKRAADHDEFELRLIDPPSRQGTLRVHVKPGLPSASGSLSGTEDRDLVMAMLNEPFRVRGVICTSPTGKYVTSDDKLLIACAGGSQFKVSFSRPLDVATLSAIRATLPAAITLPDQQASVNDYYAGYDKRAQSAGTTLAFNTSVAARQVQLTLPSDLLAKDGERIDRPTTITLNLGDFAPSLSIKPDVLIAAAGSPASPAADAVNYHKPLKLLQLAIDDRMRMQQTTLRTSSARNTVTHPVLPTIPDSIRNNGGLVLTGAKNDWSVGYAAAYAPFNVAASDDGEHVLVWASTWGDSRNLVGATVDVVQVDKNGNQQAIDTTTTASDGVAMVKPRKRADASYMWCVRVSQGGLRTVTPISMRNAQLFDASYRPDNTKLDDGETNAFGVTDRPLYRPGETVNYRIWLRKRVGNHLLAADKQEKIELELRSTRRESPFQRWPVTLDTLGSVSSQFVLPQQLPDDFYCIVFNSDDDSNTLGACFQVARFETQALWAQLHADRDAVLANQDLTLDLESGYYSGDAAADVAVKFKALLTPKRLENVYPDFAQFTFIQPDDRETGDPLAGTNLPAQTGKDGKARFTIHLPASQSVDEDQSISIPFGLLEFNAEVQVPGKASASSPTVAVNYAQYPRYVGLKSDGWWLPSNTDPVIEAVVVGYDGKPVADQVVQVSIEAVDDQDDNADTAHKVLGHCQVTSGHAAPCAFRAPEAGRYRFRASVDGAAPTQIERYFYSANQIASVVGKNTPTASLSLVRTSDGSSPAIIKLTQPYAKANVLFTIEYGHFISHFVRMVDGRESEIAIPVQANWAPGVSVHAIVRAVDPSASQGGFGTKTLNATLDLAIPPVRIAAIGISTDKQRIEPGQEVTLRLRNSSTLSRHATIAVVDDSIYQQAIDPETSDPANDNWLGSFAFWSAPPWFGLENWENFSNPFYVPGSQTDGFKRGRSLAFNSPSPRATPAPPPPPSGIIGGYANLDAITVVGSRIKRADIFAHIGARDVLARSPHSQSGKPLARTRSTFQDSAYWNPDLLLATGETRELRIKLPDNLTRWRILVWTSDETDGFALSQSTIETSLPIELRTGVPGQLYLGDQATASVSARNHGDAATTLKLGVQAEGAGVQLQQSRQASVAGNAELSQRIAFAPTETGDVQLLARANGKRGGDALSSGVSVLTTMGEGQIVQSGWIDADALKLPLPTLPAGASSPMLDVRVDRGLDAWRTGWLRDLRDYPHRCWEQTLSRAVGAALSIASDQDKTLWPEAATVIRDALIIAPAFQDDEGDFQFFVDQGSGERSGNPALSAYTLRSFELLESLGYKPSTEVRDSLAEAVAENASKVDDDALPDSSHRFDQEFEVAAESVGALDAKSLEVKTLNKLWANWDNLSWYGRSELVRALSRKPELAKLAQAGVQRLRGAGVQRGLRRVISDTRDFSYFMGSGLRDQCGVVGTLYEVDHAADGAMARRSLLRGLQDLYSGGTASLDTQSSAQCLMALHVAAEKLPADSSEQRILLSLGTIDHTLALSPQQSHAQWVQSINNTQADALPILQIRNPGATDATLNYSAQLKYALDLRQAKPQAIGMQLERSYQVLRDRKWIALDTTSLREGDWVRVKLTLNVPALRHYVAITDIVPGGLVSRDISLSGVGGVDMKHVGDEGSWWFDSRQTGQNKVMLYAEQLPPGTHDVYWFAQAVQPGDYFAPPATAELMYGRSSRSTTGPERVVIAPAMVRTAGAAK